MHLICLFKIWPLQHTKPGTCLKETAPVFVAHLRLVPACVTAADSQYVCNTKDMLRKDSANRCSGFPEGADELTGGHAEEVQDD